MAKGIPASRNCPAKIFRKSSGALTEEKMREATGNEKAKNMLRAKNQDLRWRPPGQRGKAATQEDRIMAGQNHNEGTPFGSDDSVLP
jgi:hypothetical protein